MTAIIFHRRDKKKVLQQGLCSALKNNHGAKMVAYIETFFMNSEELANPSQLRPSAIFFACFACRYYTHKPSKKNSGSL